MVFHTVGSHTLPYTFCEQIGKEIRDISDEIPFDIPESWEWVRFSNLVNFSMGKTPPRKETEYWENPIYPWVSIADMPADGTVLSTKEKVNQYAADNTFKSGISPIGTLIMSFKLTVGKVSILGIDAYHNEAIISIFPFVDDDRIVTSYLFKVLPLIAQNGDTKTAIKGATLNSDSLSNLLIPLPSLTEQKRIVNRIVELEPYVSAYDIAETHLTTLNTTFPEALKKSILQEAVQGKLVPQDPSDKPASVLLERIRAEKQKLIKAGKIKKDKTESVIVTRDKIPYEIIDGKERCIADEVPFEIPESWCWCRLGSISKNIQYGTSKKSLKEGKVPVLRMGNLQNGKIIYDKLVYSSDDDEISRYPLLFNDLLFNRTNSREIVGKTAIYKAEMPAIYAGYLVRITPMINSDYLNYIMQSQYYWIYCQSVRSDAIGQSNINAEKLKHFLVPLPPLDEQRRIVAKIEELLPFIDEISS